MTKILLSIYSIVTWVADRRFVVHLLDTGHLSTLELAADRFFEVFYS